MKRTILTLTFFLMICLTTTAQLTVDSRGNVGIKTLEETIDSHLSINSTGDSKICTYILADSDYLDTGLKIKKAGPASTANDYSKGITSDAVTYTSSNKKAFGVYTSALKENGIDGTSGRSYGIYSIAGNSSSGWNYGVFGTLCGNNNGAGIFGSSVSWDGGLNTLDRYAGYFHGKVKVTDAVYATAFNTTSDYRLKKNIESIGTRGINDILKLNVVKYNISQFSVNETDSSSASVNYYTDDDLLNRIHYGLIAQELQEIIPDIVYEGADGYLSVNYIEIIPFLIKAIQDLKSEINEMKASSGYAPIRDAKTSSPKAIDLESILYQNNPNPFTETTTIKCFIPESITKADMYIYDMNGHQIESIAITKRSEVSLTVAGNSLDAGIYFYSLITDGTIVDTKRMILTK